MKKVTIEKTAIGLIALVIGLLIGSYGSFSYMENSFKSVETVVEEVVPIEEFDSFDGEYIVKYVLKHSQPLKIGVINVKKGIVHYDIKIQSVVKSGKSTFDIKDDDSLFLDGVDIGSIIEHSKIKGDFVMYVTHPVWDKSELILEKKL